MVSGRVSSRPGKPGKPRKWATFEKNQGKPGKIREIFQKRMTNLEKTGKFIFLRESFINFKFLDNFRI